MAKDSRSPRRVPLGKMGYNALVKGLPSRSWALAGAAGLLLGAGWLRTGSGVLLLGAALAAVWTAYVTWKYEARPTAAAFLAVLLAFIALEALDARRQSRFSAEANVRRAEEES